MKRVFAVLSILIFLLLTAAKITLAEVPPSYQDTTSATQSSKNEGYMLAYPGVLPDNPLYFLKTLRDRLVSFLINDPVKRAEFNLLTADKRIAAAKILTDRGKQDLAVSTLSKSNNYFDAAIKSTLEAKGQGRNYDTVLHNLNLAIKKHKEVFWAIEKRLDRQFIIQVQKEKIRLEEFDKSVSKLLPK